MTATRAETKVNIDIELRAQDWTLIMQYSIGAAEKCMIHLRLWHNSNSNNSNWKFIIYRATDKTITAPIIIYLVLICCCVEFVS